MQEAKCWIQELRSKIDAPLRLNEPLSAHTSFRIGGPADVFLEVGSMEQLGNLVSFCRSTEASPIPLLVIGRGTNLLVSDRGVNGVVARLGGDFAQVIFEDQSPCSDSQYLKAGAAVTLSRLSNLSARRGLTGLEFAFGIPGSLGGALVMNAGTGSSSISEVVDSVEVIAQGEGDIQERIITRDELRFGYRRSNLSGYICITRASLCMEAGSPEETTSLMKRLLRQKKARQPLSAASAGCVFKNPPGMSAGKLIDECGLKGARVGGAQVSGKHANFIINTGRATASDVLSLIDRLRSAVNRNTGIELELELRIVGRYVPPEQ